MKTDRAEPRYSLVFYAIAIAIFGAGIFFILNSGSELRPDKPVSEIRDEYTTIAPSKTTDIVEAKPSNIVSVLLDHAKGSLSILLIQIITIVLAARLAGALFKKIGQPSVIGEMIAGIVLGPSVLGSLSPTTMKFLFPASSMGTLQLLSQIGIILFMFVVGMELNVEHLREKARSAVMISHASIIIPFFLGTALSLVIYRPMASSGTSFTAFALFMGTAMSITAFPVLARIIKERQMTNSRLGSTAITCAAVDDVTAWCILAIVVAVAQANGIRSSLLTIAFTLAFILVMIFVIKPWMGRLVKENTLKENRAGSLMTITLSFVLACAWATEIIGIHALFGAFLAGVVMPSIPGFRSFLREKLETFSASALLPLFFAFTGLRTQINLLNDWQSLWMCLGIIAVAILGKLGGSMLMARWTGMNWHDSFSIGVLMNTRGLMELVVLNIGYDLGILPPRIFAIMIIMALVTTCMTGPLLSWMKVRGENEALLPSGVSTAG